MGLPIGRLAERVSRLRIVAAATAIWSAATVASGMAAGFVQLMLARLTVGMGEAGFTPPTASLVSDLVPRQRRASTMSLIMLGTPAGLFLGSIMAGWVAAHHGWRAAFFVLGMPGLLVAGLVLLLLARARSRPCRGRPARKAAGAAVPRFPAHAGPQSQPAPDHRRRRAGRVRDDLDLAIPRGLPRARPHMKVGEAGAFYGSISGLALTIGLLVGSFGTDFLSRRDLRWPAWGAAIGLGLAPFLYWLAFAAESRFAASILLVLAGATLLLFFGPTTAMIQNLLQPRMRATGAALYTMLYTMIGAGLGPTFVGFVSDRLAARAFAGDYAAACPGGLPPAGRGARPGRVPAPRPRPPACSRR